MKLSKNYSLKKSKSNEIISFTFPIIDIRNKKTTRRFGEPATPRLAESGYFCSLQSSIYTKNHRFTFKPLIFCIENLSIK
jgi:hypothetical protein